MNNNPTGKGGFTDRHRSRAALSAAGRVGGAISAQNRNHRARARAVREALETVREQQRDGRQVSLPEVFAALWSRAYAAGRLATTQRLRRIRDRAA